jgi:hypothetical protein
MHCQNEIALFMNVCVFFNLLIMSGTVRYVVSLLREHTVIFFRACWLSKRHSHFNLFLTACFNAFLRRLITSVADTHWFRCGSIPDPFSFPGF